MHLSQKFKILKVHNLFYQKFPFLLQFGLYFTIIVLKIAFFNIMIVKSTFFFIDFCFFNKIILDEEGLSMQYKNLKELFHTLNHEQYTDEIEHRKSSFATISLPIPIKDHATGRESPTFLVCTWEIPVLMQNVHS